MPPSEVTRLTFGLVSAAPGSGGAASFAELAAWMAEHVGLSLSLEAAATYKDLAQSVRDGKSDVAWLPPVVYAWLAEAVTPIGSILRQGKTSYAAAIVAREGSSLAALADLSGVRAGWVDPWSAAGYVVPRIELARTGIAPAAAFRSETFYGTHQAALRALERGDCDVVGTYARARDGADGAAPGSADSVDSVDSVEGAWSEVEGLRVRVLATFGSIPPDVIAARRNLTPVAYERARDAFVRTFADPTGRRLASAVFGGDELHEGVEPGHDALRAAYESAVAKGLFD